MADERWWEGLNPGSDEYDHLSDSEDGSECLCDACQDFPIPRDVAIEWRDNLREVIEYCTELYDENKKLEQHIKKIMNE
jgi:hypothetical protein